MFQISVQAMVLIQPLFAQRVPSGGDGEEYRCPVSRPIPAAGDGRWCRQHASAAAAARFQPLFSVASTHIHP